MASSSRWILSFCLALVATSSGVHYEEHHPTCRLPCAQGVCKNVPGPEHCECYSGWYGDLCDSLTQGGRQSCSLPCAQGVCVNDQGHEYCECYTGWYGARCDSLTQVYTGECGSYRCVHGECRLNTEYGDYDRHTYHRCECHKGWIGHNCTQKEGTGTPTLSTTIPTQTTSTTISTPPTPVSTTYPTQPTTTTSTSSTTPSTSSTTVPTTKPTQPTATSTSSVTARVSTTYPAQPATSSIICGDDPGMKCDDPIVLAMICANPVTASKYCNASCGLCRPPCHDDPTQNCADPTLLNFICRHQEMAGKYCRKSCRLCPVAETWTSWSEMTSCSVTCGSGFRYRQRSCSGSGSRCVGSSTNIVKCDMSPCIECGPLSHPTHGHVQITSQSVGGASFYTCQSGSMLNGPEHRFCLASGLWSESQPTCLPECQEPADLRHGSVQFHSKDVGSTMTFTCISGYVLQGPTSRVCQADGTWSGSDVKCVVAG